MCGTDSDDLNAEINHRVDLVDLDPILKRQGELKPREVKILTR